MVLGGLKKTSLSNKDLIEKYNENNREEYFLEVDLQYPKKLHDLHNDLSVLPERMKNEKVEKQVPNLFDKKNNMLYT